MSTETPAAQPSTQSPSSAPGSTQEKLALLKQMETMMSTFAQIVRLISPPPPEAGAAQGSAESSSKTVQASRLLLEGADQLKALAERPAGTDIKETAQKLGKIIEETSARVDALLKTPTP